MKTYYLAEAGDYYDSAAVVYYYHDEAEAYKMEASLADEGNWGWSSVSEFTFEDNEDA